MEIESLPATLRATHGIPKQRKSPENGDWKVILTVFWYTVKQFRNKESLLKMEIERSYFLAPPVFPSTRNKESLLKMEIERIIYCAIISPPATRNKESLLKMEIERSTQMCARIPISPRKQRKSPENGDWKVFALLISMVTHETKKVSWKWRLKG